jgi:hypothetical protein
MSGTDSSLADAVAVSEVWSLPGPRTSDFARVQLLSSPSADLFPANSLHRHTIKCEFRFPVCPSGSVILGSSGVYLEPFAGVSGSGSPQAKS